jgi:hypothetical protein
LHHPHRSVQPIKRGGKQSKSRLVPSRKNKKLKREWYEWPPKVSELSQYRAGIGRATAFTVE